jgi:hypothetical protein
VGSVTVSSTSEPAVAGEAPASRLPELAQQAFAGVGTYPAVVDELDRYGLLRLLARGGSTGGWLGGDGLAQVAEDWPEACRRLAGRRAGLPDEARAYLKERDRERPVERLAVGLLEVTATAEIRAEVRRKVDRCARQAAASEGDFAWFGALADRPDALWLAYLLTPFVGSRIEEAEVAAEEARQQRDWLMRTQALREWSRRQNRPQALAWGVAGVAALATVWALLVAVSDVAEVSSDATVLAAWLVTMFSLSVVLTAESLLAWEIGGGFHPRYSLLGAGRIALGRRARSVLGRRSALLVVLGCVGGLVAVAVLSPVLMSAAPALLAPLWAWRRYLRWQDDRVRERSEIERAERARVDRVDAASRGGG